jgi:hypothetical protein
VDFCLKSESHRENEYLQAIQVNCPWLLRYLTAAVIACGSGSATSKDWGSRNVLRDLVKVIQHERHVYRYVFGVIFLCRALILTKFDLYDTVIQ